MREPVRDKERLVHIIEAIDRIHNRTPALDLDNLLQDALVYYGVVKSIEIIGKLFTSYPQVSRMRTHKQFGKI